MTLVDKLEEQIKAEKEKSAYLRMVLDAALASLKTVIEIEPSIAHKIPNMALIGSYIVISLQVDILKVPIAQIMEMAMQVLEDGPKAAMADLEKMGIRPQ